MRQLSKPLSRALCAGLISLGLASTAQASLIARLGGTAVYDTDLNITWLADANAGAGSTFDNGFSATDGFMTWANANAWAASLTVGGFTDWRLPTALNSDGSGPCSSSNCTGSEMGHLFYSELSGTASNSILSSGDPDLTLFTNVQSDFYWSATEFCAESDPRVGLRLQRRQPARGRQEQQSVRVGCSLGRCRRVGARANDAVSPGHRSGGPRVGPSRQAAALLITLISLPRNRANRGRAQGRTS